jgi:hypothetical protein
LEFVLTLFEFVVIPIRNLLNIVCFFLIQIETLAIQVFLIFFWPLFIFIWYFCQRKNKCFLFHVKECFWINKAEIHAGSSINSWTTNFFLFKISYYLGWMHTVEWNSPWQSYINYKNWSKASLTSCCCISPYCFLTFI